MKKSLIIGNRIFFTRKKRSNRILLIILLISIVCQNAFSYNYQDDPFRTRLGLTCTQLPEGQVEIEVLLRARIDNEYIGMVNSEVEIYTISDSANILLKKGITDNSGKVEITVNSQTDLYVDEDGYCGIFVEYIGDSKHKSSDTDLLFKAASLTMETEIIDSIKTVTIYLIEIGEESTPIEDVEVLLEVPRMFSNLPIYAESTDEEGKIEVIFPDNIPSRDGQLEIIAKVEDSDDYGSLRNQVQTDWGLLLNVDHPEERALWSQNAPMWMVWTFGFLMVLVWGHFMIILYELYLIKKEGQRM